MANEHEARVEGKELPLSFKDCIEIGNFIRGRTLKNAKATLENVAQKKVAVPIKRFNSDRGHKKGIAAGGYPVKASTGILKLILSAEANAQNKGLAVENLYIKEFISNKGSTQWHYGRKRRRQMKRAHIKIVLAEREKKKEQSQKGKQKAMENKQ